MLVTSEGDLNVAKEGGSYLIELLEFSCPRIVMFVIPENQLCQLFHPFHNYCHCFRSTLNYNTTRKEPVFLSVLEIVMR
jgi:hypothetical protein